MLTRCALLTGWLCTAVVACSPSPVGSTPVEVVSAFVERMQAVHGDPQRGRLAFELLAKDARENLAERARRATAASGRQVNPEEMLVPSAFGLAFVPRSLTPEIRGDYARVTILGPAPLERAEVHCVRENGNWRVQVDFPASPPIQAREPEPQG